ncbi:MAG TPA: hypothetical protein ENK50_00505, partial [Sedimenticola sp.]|nr:hypothetical protein [Sedimenticola sp.]
MYFFEENRNSDKGWRGASPFWKLVHLVGITLPALVFWFSPDDVLDRYPLLRDITSVAREWIPSVRNVGDFSDFPQVAELGMTSQFVSAVILFFAFRFGNTAARSRKRGITFPQNPSLKQKRQLYIVVFILTPIFFLAVFNIGPTTREAALSVATSGSRHTRMIQGSFLHDRIASGLVSS